MPINFRSLGNGSGLTESARVFTSTSECQSVLDELSSIGDGAVLVTGTSFLDDPLNGLIVPHNVTMINRGQLVFPSSFSGVAITKIGHDVRLGEVHSGGDIFNIQRAVATWDEGTDLSSVGVRSVNGIGIQFTIAHCMGFFHGLEVQGNGSTGQGGSQSCTIDICEIYNNKVNVSCPAINGGHSNGHTFRGGEVKHHEGYSSYVGTREFYFETDSDGHRILDVNIEGMLVERTLDILGSFCVIQDCWLEDSTGVWLGAFAHDTCFRGGYNLGVFPVHDSTGSRYTFNGEGFNFEGVGSAGEGFALGNISGVPRIAYDTSGVAFVTVASNGSLAAIRGANINTSGGIGLNGATPIPKPTITGSKGGNAALASLLTALDSRGDITNSTT